jgi:hypothetical protein
MDERPTKRRGPIGWAAGKTRRLSIAILILALYVLSFGPACWITSKALPKTGNLEHPPKWMIIYAPIGSLLQTRNPVIPIVHTWMLVGIGNGNYTSVQALDGQLHIVAR